MKKVRVAVVNETGSKQIPWESSSLMGNFYFYANEINLNSNYPSSYSSKIDEEEEMWLLVNKSESIEELEVFLQTFSHGRFKQHANLRIKQLRRQGTTAERLNTKTKQQKVVRDYVKFYQSGAVQKVPPYGSIDIPGSGGRVIFSQDNKELYCNFHGLLSQTNYKVYMRNFNNPYASGWTKGALSGGPFTEIGTFITSHAGKGSFVYANLNNMKKGEYIISIWINDANKGATLLLSGNYKMLIQQAICYV